MSLRKIIKACSQVGFVILFANVISFGQKKEFTAEQVRKDMTILNKKLLRFHPAPFTYIDSVTHQSRFLEAYNNITDSLNTQEAFDVISPILTDVKDLHTSAGMPKDWSKKQKKQLPLFYREFDGAYYISYNCSSDTTLLRGIQVLKIEDKPISDLVYQARSFYATDNDNDVSKRYYSVVRLPNILNRMMPITDSMKVEFRYVKADSVFVKYIKTEEPKQIAKVFKLRYPKLLRKNFDYEILDSLNKIAKLDITTFSEKGKLLNINQRKFKKKLQAKMKQIEKDTIQTLILDLRGNGGGSIVNISRLVGYFAKEKYKMLDSMAVKKKAFLSVFPLYGIIAPVVGRVYFNKKRDEFFVDMGDKKAKNKPTKKHHFDGELYVMGDGGTYSASVYTISLLQELGLATYLGDRAGGTRWGSFAGKWHKGALPNTKVQYRIPYFKIAHYLPNTAQSSLFIEPDVQLKHTWGDFLRFEDSYMKQAVELINAEKE
ncbi:Peptidase family S41 [Spirosomataceae bacterium TFI 002]|nr:Peptidase family S41 [Spirosomataceae bacterium TFI 002]